MRGSHSIAFSFKYISIYRNLSVFLCAGSYLLWDVGLSHPDKDSVSKSQKLLVLSAIFLILCVLGTQKEEFRVFFGTPY